MIKRYQAHFYGRTKGAIGIDYWITTEVEGVDPEDARLRLYERFDHVMGLKLLEVSGAGDDHDPVR